MKYEPIKVELIDQEKTSLEEVVSKLTQQKFGTKWAEKTNDLCINYALHLGEVYGDVWYKGFLPKEFFLDIKLPQHGHLEEKESHLLLFPDDTSVADSGKYYRNADTLYTKDCLELINFLKEEIKEKGFNSEVFLVVINNNLKHVDGLHRMVALNLLLEEGYTYKPIPVFLCDSTK